MSYGLIFATPFIVVAMLVSKGLYFFDETMGPTGITALGSGIVEKALTNESPLVALMIGFMAYLMSLNVAVGGFNLMPMYPLDGGHIMGGFIERWFPNRAARVLPVFQKATFVLSLWLVGVILLTDVLKGSGLFGF
jgi:membrane-associated protease RseP (regulator of RpoE activity)